MTTLREQIAEWELGGRFCRVGNRQRRIGDVVDWEIGGLNYGDRAAITIYNPIGSAKVLLLHMTEQGLRWSVVDVVNNNMEGNSDGE
jgi:hypothetical protein